MATKQDYSTKADLEEALEPIHEKLGNLTEKITTNHEIQMAALAELKDYGRNPNF